MKILVLFSTSLVNFLLRLKADCMCLVGKSSLFLRFFIAGNLSVVFQVCLGPCEGRVKLWVSIDIGSSVASGGHTGLLPIERGLSMFFKLAYFSGASPKQQQIEQQRSVTGFQPTIQYLLCYVMYVMCTNLQVILSQWETVTKYLFSFDMWYCEKLS